MQALHKAALQAVNAYDEGDIRNTLDADFADIEGYYFSNDGTFLLGFLSAELVTMGALAYSAPNVFEVCRMRTHPNYQGRGHAKAMYEKLEKHACKHEATMLILRTDKRLAAAQRFYQQQGFCECKPTATHWQNAATFNGALYFEKQL